MKRDAWIKIEFALLAAATVGPLAHFAIRVVLTLVGE